MKKIIISLIGLFCLMAVCSFGAMAEEPKDAYQDDKISYCMADEEDSFVYCQEDEDEIPKVEKNGKTAMKGNIFYFIDDVNRLLAVNLITGETMFIQTDVNRLSTFGPYGKYISYYTNQGDLFATPYEVDRCGVFYDYTSEFGN